MMKTVLLIPIEFFSQSLYTDNSWHSCLKSYYAIKNLDRHNGKLIALISKMRMFGLFQKWNKHVNLYAQVFTVISSVALVSLNSWKLTWSIKPELPLEAIFWTLIFSLFCGHINQAVAGTGSKCTECKPEFCVQNQTSISTRKSVTRTGSWTVWQIILFSWLVELAKFQQVLLSLWGVNVPSSQSHASTF
jgi:hypothetical protein